MPGSFPMEGRSPIPPTKISEDMMEVVNDEYLENFQKRQKISRKTIRQSNLINQLDSLIYILAGYQLIKYCHSASLIPLVVYVISQKFLCCDSFTSTDSSDNFMTFLNQTERQNQENNVDPEPIMKVFFKKIQQAIYWKSLLVMIYHIGFVCFWLIPLANKGKLNLVVNGTWWFVSFIGETIPIYESLDTFKDRNYITKMMDLGLVGLLFSDAMILLIQLILFQSIYIQSTLSPMGRKLNGKEIELLRLPNDVSTSAAADELLDSPDESPFALHVRLYEALNLKLFDQ